jgi:hypothetical protein
MLQDDIKMNELIQEAGLLSRASARTKALGGAVKQGIGDVATAISGKKPALDAGWRGKYRENKQKEILSTLSNDILTDLKKLGLIPSGSPVNQRELQNILNQYISKYTGVGRQADTQQSQTTQLPSTQTAPQTTATASDPQSTGSASQSTTPAWRDVFKPSETTPTSTVTQTTPTATTSTATPTGTTKPATKQSKAATPEPVQEEIPNESTITDKKGNVYEYHSDDKSWYIRSKTGGSASEIPNNSPELQKIISKAWSDKNEKEKTEKLKASTPDFLKPGEEPDTEIPDEAEIADKKGSKYQFNKEDNKWYRVSKSGKSLENIPDEAQQVVSGAWQRKQKKEKEQPKETMAFEESFKMFFWK